MNVLVTGCNVRCINGTFDRLHDLWSLDNFDDGYIDSSGRFRVYLPTHLRSSGSIRYVLRSIVAYEAYHGIKVTNDYEIHHKDGNKLNDSKDNLIILTNSDHQKEHARLRGCYVLRVCKLCNKEFKITRSKFNDVSSGAKERGVFCSQKCYHDFPKSDETSVKQSKSMKNYYLSINCYIDRSCLTCGKKFTIIRSKLKLGLGKYCSRECMYRRNEVSKRKYL